MDIVRTMAYIRTTLQWMVLLGVFIQSDCLQCPRGFVGHGLSCYHFSHDTETWIDAMNVCEKIYGGILAEVNDVTENNFLIGVSSHNRVEYWIGGNDLKVEGEWVWYDSQQPVASNLWGHGGGTSNSFGNENCLEILVDRWNDDQCHKPQHYICEVMGEPSEIVG